MLFSLRLFSSFVDFQLHIRTVRHIKLAACYISNLTFCASNR